MAATANKSSKNRYDLTQGNIFKRLILLALPVMGGQFMQMAYTLADMFWLGSLSSDAVAASSTAGMFIWMSMGLMMMVRIGTEIGVSQSVGSGDSSAAKSYTQSAFSLAILLGLGFAAFVILGRVPLIGFFEIPSEQVIYYSQVYLAISGVSIPFMYASAVIAGCFAGHGNTRLPFLAQSTGLIINIFLSPMLIFWADLGIAGAAYATIVARIIELSLLIAAIKLHKSRPFEKFALLVKPIRKYLRNILKWGVPVACEITLFAMLAMIPARLIAEHGVYAMAVQRVGFQLESLSWMVGAGFGTAVTAFVGQNFGAGQWARIHKGFKVALVSMSVWGSVVSLFLFIYAEPLISIFLRSPEEIALGGTLLRILAICQIPQSIEGSMAACFRGRGKTLQPSIVSITTNLLRVPLAIFLNSIIGVFGIWLAMAIGGAARGTWLLLWYLWDSRKLPRENTFADNTTEMSHV